MTQNARMRLIYNKKQNGGGGARGEKQDDYCV
jgi:hypothetical protein